MTEDNALLAVMRRTPTGVAVLTVEANGQRVGLTVATLVTLSLEPPLVGVAVSRQAAIHELLRDAGACALSLLAADQQPLADHFARGVPPIGMWQGIALRDAPVPPLLEGALGWLACRVRDQLEAGTHTFFVLDVLRAEQGSDGPPLVRVGGAYA